MKNEDIKVNGIYAYNDASGQTELVEVMKVFDYENKIKVTICKSSNQEEVDIVSTKSISPVIITEAILKALSFEEVTENLYGLPNERFFQLKMDNRTIEIIKDRGAMKYVQPSSNQSNHFGCKFISLPFLHQLQEMIGRIDIKIIREAFYSK